MAHQQPSDVELVRHLIQYTGDEPDREGLKDTPDRYLRALFDLTNGYNRDITHIFKSFEDGAQGYDQMVFQGSIPVYSLCEHHLLPFFGVAHVGYIANGRVIGLSKIARLVEVFMRRLQVQERLTSQIAACLQESDLRTLGVGVILRCRHLCMEARGIQKMGTQTITSALTGVLRSEPETRAEFMKLVEMADRHHGPI